MRLKETWTDIPLWHYPEPYTSITQDGREKVIVRVLTRELSYGTLGYAFSILDVVGLLELVRELPGPSVARSRLRHLVLESLARELGVPTEKLKGVHRIVGYGDKLQGRP